MLAMSAVFMGDILPASLALCKENQLKNVFSA